VLHVARCMLRAVRRTLHVATLHAVALYSDAPHPCSGRNPARSNELGAPGEAVGVGVAVA
jgi:hypothetical protein